MGSITDLVRIESPQIRKIGEFIQIAGEGDCVLVRCLRDVINNVVKFLETGNGYRRVAARADGLG